MRRIVMAAAVAAALLAARADAATLALPGVVFTAAGSTSVACTETAAGRY